jgi:Nucleotidyltransferase domain
MLESLGLSPLQISVLKTFTGELAEIPGVLAVVLGGSFARGTARPDSDIDVGFYYSENAPPEIEAVRRCAEQISLPQTPPTVSNYYAWGPWVNGGAWIQTPAGKLDLLYRNIQQVQRVLDESHQGIYQHDYYQQPTFGFISVIYLAEIKCCVPLFDPENLLQRFKRNIESYPPPLQDKLVKDCLTVAEFTLSHAHGFADRGDLFNTLGCLTKIGFALSQTLFALNAEYYFGDKGSLESLDKLANKPQNFSAQLRQILRMPYQNSQDLQRATINMQTLWKQVVEIAADRYTPKFGLDG